MTQTTESPLPDSAPTPTPFGPVTEPERIVTLDVLRGFALLGIFMVNIQFFSMVFSAMFEPSIFEADAPIGDKIAWGIVKVFFEYKFISLFSLMFGAGLVLQFTRAEQRGRPFVAVYLRRLGVLACIGLVHAFVLWYGDILFFYACVGAVVLVFRKMKPRRLIIVAASILTAVLLFQITVGTLVIIFVDEIKALQAATEVEETPTTEAESEASVKRTGLGAMIDAGFDVTSQDWIDAETIAYRDGPFTDAITFRTFTYLLLFFFAPLGYGWRVVGMFLLGAGLMKLGVFSPSRKPWHWWFLALGLLVGFPLELANALLTYAGGAGDRLELVMLGAMLHEVGSFSLCLGIVGGVALLVSSGVMSWLVNAIACVGRLALTNYILQTVLTTFLMYWWGLGYFGALSRLEQLGLVVLIYGGQIVGSVLWLRVFSIGPLEWLWRSLTYLKPQPFLRASSRRS